MLKLSSVFTITMEKFYNKKGQEIGTLKDNIFRKRVKKSKHLMRKLNAWGIQLDALMELQKQGCKEIRVLEEEEQKIYSIPLEKIWKGCTVENFGDGDQAFLPISEWKVTQK